MASIAALLSALATMSKDGVLSALNVIAALVTEESLLRILGDYVNSQTGMKKSAVRFEIYSNHEKEYYLVLGIVHPTDAGVAKKKVSVEQINELMTDLAKDRAALPLEADDLCGSDVDHAELCGGASTASVRNGGDF